jgi:hypothetical protein
MAVDTSILTDLENTVFKLRDSINESLKQSIDTNKNVLIDMQTEKQMFQGINSEGNSIRPFYKSSTIRKKLNKRPPQPVDRVTLKDTSDFYNSIEIEARKDDFVISTQISYSIYLIDKYSKILGITAVNLKEFIDKYTLNVIKKNFDDIIAES